MKTLDSYNFKGKTVLVRSDLNSEVIKGKISQNERLKSSKKTISELLKKGAKVVVLAHQGRPKKKDFTSLKQHAKLLGINFVPDIIGKKAVKAIKELKPKQALLLENVRKLKEEFENKNNKLVKTLVPLCDYYVNDAFSVCHRKQTSLIQFPKKLKSCIGRTLETELKHLKNLKKDTIYILGGGKPNDVALLLNKKQILLTGDVANIGLQSRGYKIGKTEKRFGKHPSIIKKLKNKN